MSDNRDWQADKINNLLKRCEIAKSYGETIAVSPDAIIELINQAAADKQRADISELAYQGLQEDVVTIGEYQSLLDKHTAVTKAYRGEKERADQAEAREQKLVQHLKSYMPHMWPAMAAHFEVLFDAMYPKEATENE